MARKSLVTLKCPNCGVVVTVDRNDEVGQCSICGEDIPIEDVLTGKVAFHEDPENPAPSINTYMNHKGPVSGLFAAYDARAQQDKENDGPSMPAPRRKIWGFFLTALGIIGLIGDIGLGLGHTIICIAFIVGGIALLISYYLDLRAYNAYVAAKKPGDDNSETGKSSAPPPINYGIAARANSNINDTQNSNTGDAAQAATDSNDAAPVEEGSENQSQIK